MSVTGTCPKCQNNKAQFLTIDSNKNISVDCPSCGLAAAVSLEKGLKLINNDEFPIVF